MKQRAVELLLVLVVLVGAVLALWSGQERRRLQAEHTRLAQITGDLPVEDPSKVYLRALPTNEPLHFAWRVYYPPNYRDLLKHGAGSSHSSWSRSAREFIARVRFREDSKGHLHAYTRFHGGSSTMGLGDRRLSELLQGRWDKIQVEQLGADGIATLETDESAVVLRLTLPRDMQEEARTKLPNYFQDRYSPVLFELTLGR